MSVWKVIPAVTHLQRRQLDDGLILQRNLLGGSAPGEGEAALQRASHWPASLILAIESQLINHVSSGNTFQAGQHTFTFNLLSTPTLNGRIAETLVNVCCNCG